MFQPDSNRALTSTLVRGLTLAGLTFCALQSDVQAQRLAATPIFASSLALADPVPGIVEHLLRADDLQLSAFGQRWGEVPAPLQGRIVQEVALLDHDRSLPILIGMLAGSQEEVRPLVGQALRAETGLRLPDCPVLWKHWLDGEETWLRVRGRSLVTALASSDEALVVRATREIAQHRIHKRAFALELQRNLLRDSLAIRSVTARALGELGDQRAAGALRTALGDQAPAVRREALSALRRLAGELG